MLAGENFDGLRVWHNVNHSCRMLKKVVQQAAASEGRRRTSGVLEGLNDARTPLAAFSASC